MDLRNVQRGNIDEIYATQHASIPQCVRHVIARSILKSLH